MSTKSLQKMSARALVKEFEAAVLSYDGYKISETKKRVEELRKEVVRRLQGPKPEEIREAVEAFDAWLELEDPSSCPSDIPTENAAIERIATAVDALKRGSR